MATNLDIAIIIVEDVTITLDAIPMTVRSFRENQDHYFNVGAYINQSTPVSIIFAVSEQSDTDNAISGLGLAYRTDTSMEASTLTYASSVTLTSGQASAIEELWIKFTAANITGGDKNVTIRMTVTDP